ncbi:class I SAM-dependent RNA methyltransferase [Pseudokineococcus sp. 1T1Z-3]|uniref:class I SAM-dependent RNA methyltransferase n=1 Tax=Pseudokineococcus sp. 1T1Z-3 TaxID=3132745 RepID=UPI00309D57BD
MSEQAVLLELEVGAVAHGGHCVARHEGRVVFVRHALPGERVRARVTEAGEGASFWRADAVEVLEPSPDRVEPACPVAGPGRCGGCDWQHAHLPAQRALKTAVLREQLARLAGLEVDAVVEEVPVPASAGTSAEDAARGLGWRTRVGYAVDGDGRLGFRAHREHRVVPVERCPLATPGVVDLGLPEHRWKGWRAVEAVVPAGDGGRLVVAEGRSGAGRGPSLPALATEVATATTAPTGPRRPPAPVRQVRGRTWVRETVGGRSFRVTGGGFWQVHPGAAQTLSSAVLEAARPRGGEVVLDLYSGAGLLTAALAEAVGEGGRVVAVEGDARAVADARRNLHDLPQVRLVQADVRVALAGAVGGGGQAGRAGEVPATADVVVLDPPRTGARAAVVAAVAARAPRAVVHVACDPAALARDVALFAEHGYALASLRAFDLFPSTHHLEAVALLAPAAPARDA